MCPVFNKDDPADGSNYKPISSISVPSKILESCVSDTILDDVVENGLLTERQWAYRKGHSTQLLLAHLTESWRQTIDNNLVVATSFVDLLGVTKDHKTYVDKASYRIKEKLCQQAQLLRKCTFLTRKSLLDLYFKTMLPSVTYGITLWGNCNNCDHIKSLQALHCRTGRIIFNFPWDTPSKTVMEVTQWDSVYEMYKLSLVKFFYNIACDNTPYLIQNLVTWRESPYNLRGNNKTVVP